MTPYCPNGHVNRPNARFCSTCRAPIAPASGSWLVCNTCRNQNPIGQALCTYCRTPLQQAQTIPVVATTLPANSLLYGRYTITRWVGGGGMGAVYEAMDNRISGRRVAVKEVNAATIPNPQEAGDVIRMFHQEAQLLAQLKHANLPGVSDFFSYGSKQYLVMEFVNGRTLEKALEENRGPVSDTQAVSIGVQLCDVLEYLHTRATPIIFRDLKPANVMIDDTFQIKLIDFGIARRYKPRKSTDTSQFGSAGYAPPEQYGHGQTDARSDIYSLCVTLYHLLTRYDPALNPFNLPPLLTLNPSVAPQLAAIITRGMATDPNQRWQSVREMRAELARYRPAGAGQAGGSSRITTKLILKAAEIPREQLVVGIATILLAIVGGAFIAAPALIKVSWFWSNVDMGAIVAPFVYAAARKRYMTGIAQTLIFGVSALAVWSSLQYDVPYENIILSAAASGVFVELWLALIGRVRGPGADPWVREVAWLALMGVIVTAMLRIWMSNPSWGLNPILWIVSAGIGTLGWFFGDLIQQYMFLRQRGFRRAGYF